MRNRRRSKISESLAFALALGSTGCGGAALDTSLELKDATRKPDGVLLEPAPAIPNAEERGKAQAGVLALRQPITDEQIGELARKYVHAFTQADASAFSELLVPEAVLFGDNGRSAPRTTLTQNFTQRIQQHRQEYLNLHADIVRLDRVVRFSAEDLNPHSDPPRPMEMKQGDVYARVPLDPKMSLSGDPLFRSTLVLLLRRAPDHTLKLAGVAETDSP